MKYRTYLFWMVAILLLAASVRIINVGRWPVWTDEGWSIWAASSETVGEVWNRVETDRHPPAYFLALHLWEPLAGTSRLALRYLSIMGGLLTVAIIYRIGCDTFGNQSGIFAALISAVLGISVYYSQEVRHYGWLSLSICTMTLLFLRYLQRPRNGLLVAYAASIVFMLYTLYFGVLILAAQIFVGLFLWRGKWIEKRALIVAWMAAAVLYIPWMIVLLDQFRRLSTGLKIGVYPSTLTGISGALVALFNVMTIPLLVLYALAFVAIFLHRSIYNKRLMKITLILSSGAAFIVMVIANTSLGLLTDRTLSFLAPMALLVIGYGLAQMPRWWGMLAVCAIIVSQFASHEPVQRRLRSDRVAEVIVRGYSPGDLIVIETGWDDNALLYEITQMIGQESAPNIIRTLPWDNDYSPRQPVVPQIEGALRIHRRTWLVNWLVYSQVRPYLDGGGNGYRPIQSEDVPVGDDYQNRYSDTAVHVSLYVKAPSVSPVACGCNDARFGDTLWMRDLVYSGTIERGRTAHIDLWWSALNTPPRDYTIVVFLLDDHDVLRVRDDHVPDVPTSHWKTEQLYFTRHSLTIPRDLRLGSYQVAVKVYVTDRAG